MGLSVSPMRIYNYLSVTYRSRLGSKVAVLVRLYLTYSRPDICLGTLAKMHKTRMTLVLFKTAPCCSKDTFFDLFTQTKASILAAFLITDDFCDFASLHIAVPNINSSKDEVCELLLKL